MEITYAPPKFTDGKVVALVDVELVDGIVVRGFRIVKGNDGPFAAVPSRSYEADDGQTKWYPLVLFSSPELKERFQSELLEGYQQWNKTRDSGDGRDENAPPF
jgi:DNA-binding cell septation regulator SpoVG